MATGLATATTKFGRQVIPGDAGLEDKQDAGEDLAIVQRLATGKAETALGWRGQQGLDMLPKFVADQRFHGVLSLEVGGYSLSYPQVQLSCHLFIFSERS